MSEELNALQNRSTNFLEEIIEIVSLVEMETSSSSDEDSEYERTQHPKCTDFVATIDAMSEDVFKSHMRVKRNTAEYLITQFSQSSFGMSESTAGRPQICVKTSIYAYIWYISNTVTFRQLGNLFGLTKSSAWKTVRRVTSWLISISHEYIKWPQGQEIVGTSQKFYAKFQIPNVIGAIDCTHIAIKAPVDSKQIYFDRKQNYSLVLQAIVDADKKFLNIYCGEPGSLHDSRVLRRSSFFKKAEENLTDLFPNSTFILGDSAYFTTKWLVPPFKDNGNLTRSHNNFNKRHSGTRVIVENTFGLLKMRFRRLLKFTEQRDMNAVTNLIGSICVMHNICLLKDDLGENENFEIEAPETISTNYAIVNFNNGENINLRDQLFNYLREKNLI